MKWLKYVSIILLLTLVSCSGNKKTDTDENGDDETVELDSDFIVDSEDEDLTVDDELVTEESSDSDNEGPSIEDSPTISEAPSMDAGANGTYTVKSGDTLMWIAFKIYGDYSKWADLSSQNGNIVRISEGQVLNFTEPAEKFSWEPKGNPYTIINGDTLGTISNDKYGSSAKWKSIYDNNRPMIKNPNLIFAGFTLYYIPSRDLASE
ncbi:MAG: LysM peptidoglycan-binding domain-containing protein [Bacteriovoracaceae bacterium]|jgi:nucleoid-associated protein YgaU|nr:LysM peptidoglycan-binding domain-containing protein [Bacteriovoracaceae bacterium]